MYFLPLPLKMAFLIEINPSEKVKALEIIVHKPPCNLLGQ